MLPVWLLSAQRLEAAWSIGHAMHGDGIEQPLVEALAKRGVAMALNRDHQLEGLQRLERSFEANRSRLDAVLFRSLHQI
jgi:hypothetical protein